MFSAVPKGRRKMEAIFPSGRPPRCAGNGFTYLGLLLVVATMGLLMALAAQVWETNIRREKERELLFAGHQIRQAIGRYYEAMPDGVKRYPARLEDLLQDNRYPGIKRHLRRLYPDPLTGAPRWGVILSEEGGIRGVYSLSPLMPLKQVGFDEADMDFENRQRYSEWQFVYIPAMRAVSRERENGEEPAVLPDDSE